MSGGGRYSGEKHSKVKRPENARVRGDEYYRVARRVTLWTSEQRCIGNENVQKPDRGLFQREC